jgi:hypothetical protein
MTRYSLLSAGECRRVESSVLALAERWRGNEQTLRTLGSPVYRNVEDMPVYFAHAAQDNPLLRAHFAWLYERVFNLLEWVLEVPVELAPNAALPGFHILDTSNPYPGGGLHIDSGHEALGFPSLPNIGDNVAFTLPVGLPCEAGVDVALEGVGTPAACCFKFQLGYLHLFAGNRPHQIAPCPAVRGLRMTLQGHAVPLGARAAVFW